MYDFKTFQFGRGNHKTRKDGLCVQRVQKGGFLKQRSGGGRS
jgi:hypothetical protein